MIIIISNVLQPKMYKAFLRACNNVVHASRVGIINQNPALPRQKVNRMIGNRTVRVASRQMVRIPEIRNQRSQPVIQAVPRSVVQPFSKTNVIWSFPIIRHEWSDSTNKHITRNQRWFSVHSRSNNSKTKPTENMLKQCNGEQFDLEEFPMVFQIVMCFMGFCLMSSALMISIAFCKIVFEEFVKEIFGGK